MLHVFGTVCIHKGRTVLNTFFHSTLGGYKKNGGHKNKQYLLVSGGGNAWAQVIPGGVIEHLRNMSDSTVAHWTFFTNSGIIVANSFLPKEWLSAQAQCISLMAGWVSYIKHTTKSRWELITMVTNKIGREEETSSRHNWLHSLGCRLNVRFSLRAWRVCMRGWDIRDVPCIWLWWRAVTRSWCATRRPALFDKQLQMLSRRSRTASTHSKHNLADPKWKVKIKQHLVFAAIESNCLERKQKWREQRARVVCIY